jgi:23S rRNA pseudouridine2457 synthase
MENLVYVAFYKPYGVLTAFTDPDGRETLKAYVDVPDIYPAGRLDLDSEGLLLLTNDGSLAHRLTDPRYNHPKTYLVQVEGIPSAEALARLESGVEVKGRMTRPSQAMVIPEPDLPPRSKPVTPHGPTTWLRIVLREGMKRQVRHMTAAVGLPTLRLVRAAIGPIDLNNLQPGEWRYLTPAEVSTLKQLVSGPPVPRPPARRNPDKRLSKAGGKPAGSPGSNRGSRYRSGGRRSPGR